jgi:hypothetical protein
MNLRKWLYRGGRPNWLATVLNKLEGLFHTVGIAPNYLVTLEVPGRRSGKRIGLPLVMVVLEGERYLVSMLGADVNWVRNVRAAGVMLLYAMVATRRYPFKRLRRRSALRC